MGILKRILIVLTTSDKSLSSSELRSPSEIPGPRIK